MGGKIYVRRFKEWELKHSVLLLVLYLWWNELNCKLEI